MCVHTLIQAPGADTLQLKSWPPLCLFVLSPVTDVNLNSLILDDPKWTVGMCSQLLVQGFIKVPLLQESVQNDWPRSLCLYWSRTRPAPAHLWPVNVWRHHTLLQAREEIIYYQKKWWHSRTNFLLLKWDVGEAAFLPYCSSPSDRVYKSQSLGSLCSWNKKGH